MEMIRLSSFAHYLNLPRNKWNIPQPPDDEVLESVFDSDELGLVLTPGLAFTLQGSRLGRGKGYYDKFFSKCEKTFKKSPIKMGLAFNEQIVPSIPMTETDVPLDFVITAGS